MSRFERRAGPSAVEQQAGLRVSDREREQAVDLLSRHAGEGRLTLEELEARIDGSHAARTRGEVALVTADLPGGVGGDHPGRTPSRAARGPTSGQLVAFVAVNLVLLAIWALSGMGYFWPAWPLLGWGLALVKPGRCGGRRTARGPGHGRAAAGLGRGSGGGG